LYAQDSCSLLCILIEDEFDGEEAASVYITTWPNDCTTAVLDYLF